MKTIYGIENYKKSGRPVYAAMGAFDGIHHGHARLIGMAVNAAHKNGGEAVVLTFRPHPKRFITSDRRFELITPFTLKEKIIAGLGVDTMLVVEFTDEIAHMQPEEFIEKYLVSALGVTEVFVGFNFYFGANRAGNAATLEAAGARHGFRVSVLSPIEIGNFIVSSSKIRLLIEAGAVDDVIKFMGRPFVLSGRVVHGDGLGKKLKVPTANIELPDDGVMIPKTGVYAVKCRVSGAVYDGVMNIGVRPTIYEKKSAIVTLELHIIGFNGDLYGKIVDAFFIKRLRDEKKFSDFTSLCAQIEADIKAAAEYFGENPDFLKGIEFENE